MTTMVTDPIRWWGQESPDDPAIIFDARDSVTYGELDQWTDRVARWLTEAGLRPGDRVGVVGPNSLEWCAGALGALKAGGIVAAYNNRFLAEELSHLVENSEPTIVLADEEHMDRMKELQARGLDFQLVSLGQVSALRQGPHEPFERVEVDPDQAAVIVYTSGTTSQPKGVVYTHRTIFGFVFEWSVMEPAWGKGAKVLFVLSLGGAPGLLWAVIQTLTHGGTLFMEKGFEPRTALKRLVEERIGIFFGVPVLFEQMGALPEFAEADLSAVQFTTVGGARVQQPTLEAWLEKGVALRQIWGMTELGGSVTATNVRDARIRPESFGRGSVFTRIRVVRPDGTDCDPGEPGEIICRGPAVTPGYWRNQEATDAALRDGWFHSGDLGVRDAEGYVRMIERIKDMIISGGYNIAPAEIEAVIGQLPGVQEVAVISVPDEKFGEAPAAVVRATTKMSSEDVIAYCAERLSRYKLPRYVVFEDEPLPRFASGKLAKRDMRERYETLPESQPKLR